MVSIITPSHNTEKFITKAMDSVLAQSDENWEMIIVDDLSTDSSPALIEAYAQKDPRIKLLRTEQRSGAAGARNRAIEAAQGRYIAFLDADDLWMPHKLEKQLAFMNEHNLVFTYSSYKVFNEEDEVLTTFVTLPEISYESMLKTCSVGCLTAIYDAEKLGKMYLPDLPTKEEYVLWLNIMKKIGRTRGIIEPLAYYRVGETSVSSDKVNAAAWQWKVYRDIEHLGLTKSIYYFANYVYYGLKKYR
jgi:glycosyltransferase involved in cell wall biosynthesis